ncbi:putative topoisomerase family protein [Neofusicoccum parvum UCRNP2]|uniref:polynucleotide adenylyltransferase n=1 Tax=Botryosphaeria parva (strain UCR-NP2) TaxID=1287680 RepID=R1EQV1_BOTPV|nr:putative topoisomerase family protein [Neofusicoccum parvum UCRNP2]
MKRAYQDDDDDDLESLPPPPKSKKRKREVIDGRVVEDWRPRAETPRAPWCTSDHSGSANMSTWLHKEISDFYDYVKPHPFEDEIRRDLVKRIERSLQVAFHGKQFFRNGQGSFQKRDLYKVSSVLERDGISQPGATEVVAKARVPIVKLVDRVTGLKVDISFDNQTGIVANKTFQEWKKIYPAMPVIATLVKQFLAMRGLNEVYTGGLGGFSVICLVVSLIHTMPVRQSNNHTADSDFGELLLNFFDLYGNKFNLNTTRISLNPIEYVVKGSWDLNGKPTRADRLSIIDPNTANNDISSGSHNVVLIQRCFRDAFKELQRRMAQLKACAPVERKNESILSVLFAGDYSSFQWQRNRLRKIFESNRHREQLNAER